MTATSSSWRLPDDLSASAAARTHVTRWAHERGWTDDDIDDLLVVVSELAANAAQHGRPPLTLDIHADDATVTVTLSERASGTVPQLQQPGPFDGRGRGLAMVAALSEASGWEQDGHTVRVWARLSHPV